jgi:hypothetical protein
MLIAGLQGRVDTAQLKSGPPSKVIQVPTARPATIRFPSGRVRVLTGGRPGDTITLDRVVATFGSPGKQTAVVTRRPHGYFITHVEGRRYPRVNRRSIGKEARVLHHGDVIEVADEKLEFLADWRGLVFVRQRMSARRTCGRCPTCLHRPARSASIGRGIGCGLDEHSPRIPPLQVESGPGHS